MEIIQFPVVETQEGGEMPQEARPEGKHLQVFAGRFERDVKNYQRSTFKTHLSLS